MVFCYLTILKIYDERVFSVIIREYEGLVQLVLLEFGMKAF